MVQKSWIWKIVVGYVRCGHSCGSFSALPGAVRWAHAPPCGRGSDCGNDFSFVSRFVQAIFFQMAFSQNFGRQAKSPHGDTFWYIILVPLDALSICQFQVKHQGMIWSERCGPEHLLRREIGWAKVGCVVQKSHGSEILDMKHCGELRSLRALVWNFSALLGAVRWALAFRHCWGRRRE